jgi:glycosyltransferase involved in cell wall biosynthesis
MRLVSLLLCEDVRKEIRGTHTIVGQFNTLRGFLLEEYSFKCFFGLTGAFGMMKLKVVVKSPEGVELKKFYTDDIPCTNRQDHFTGYFPVSDLFLKSYGSYMLYVYDAKDDTELGKINMNYLVPNHQTNTLMINKKEVVVPRVNFQDNRELQDYAKIFLKQHKPLEKPFKTVDFHSQFSMNDGIGSVSIHLVEQMAKSGKKVRAIPIYRDSDSVTFSKRMVDSSFEGPADIAIVNALPPLIKSACNAERILMFGYWEASKIDRSWVNVTNCADGVFVPSQYVKKVYKDSGVKSPIVVYKQPIAPDFKYVDKNEIKLAEDKEYFDVLFLGTCIERKGFDIFTKAVDEVFGSDKDVRVRIHTKPWRASLGNKSAKLVKSYENNKQYFITTNMLDLDEIVSLLQSADLLVAPSRSEGLGLIPIQAVMCGTPSIVPDHSGFMEYNNTPGFLKIEKSKMVPGTGIYNEGYWYEPDFNELCEKLVYAKNNREKLLEEAKRGSKILREEYSVLSTYSAVESLINNMLMNRR